ncbi:hypothetical protein ROT00_00530 [Agromyces mediolanus]
MSHDKNDELRSEHAEQARHRQKLRDEAPEGEHEDLGSQDERRAEDRRL